MGIKEKINSDYLKAFKERDPIGKSILSLVKGEIQTIEKNVNVADLSDKDVTKIIQKIMKSLDETISKSGDDESIKQRSVLVKYLPEMMTDEQIKDKILSILSNGPASIGDIMKSFSEDNVDKKSVSKIFSFINSK